MNTDVNPEFTPHRPSFTMNPNLPLNTPQTITSTNPRSTPIIASSLTPPPSTNIIPSSFQHKNSNCPKILTLASPSSRPTKPHKHKPKPKPKPKTLNLNKEIPPCSECGKKFYSAKALHGHMRCHPERNWRGINPPDKQTRPVTQPITEPVIRPVARPDMTSVSSADLSKFTEYEIQAMVNLVLMSKGVGFEEAKEVPSGSKSKKRYKKKNGVFEKKRSYGKIGNGDSSLKREEDGAIDSNPSSVVKREEGSSINPNPNPNPNPIVVLDLNLTPRD